MKQRKYLKIIPRSLVVIGLGVFTHNVFADQQILDDLIVDGSACIGQDCVNGESFGFDTLRLKENNLRIKFQDTSTSASFPSNDWQLTANDSSNGGANKFSIDDIDGGRTPFTIEASAPNNSLYVEDGGRVGFGTATPVVELHSRNGDSPTLRLEQDGSSGFTPQTWDMAGNETNFFIRDVSNGSQLPFRIKPGADSNSLFIAANNNIGLGTESPATSLHMKRTDAELTIENTNSTVATRTLVEMTNNGAVGLSMEDRDQAVTWDFRTSGTGNFIINDVGDGAEVTIFRDGNMTVSGTVTANGVLLTSSRESKTDFSAIKPTEVMQKLAKLELQEWRYKEAEKHDRHISPMAEDFHELFRFGPNNKGINPNDLASVAIIAAKELQKKVDVADVTSARLEAENVALKQQLNKKTTALKAENDMLQKRLASLEKLVTNLASANALEGKGKEVAFK